MDRFELEALPDTLMVRAYPPLVALHFATDDLSSFDADGVVWCIDFVKANKQLPSRLRPVLGKEDSNTLTTEMLNALRSRAEFERLS